MRSPAPIARRHVLWGLVATASLIGCSGTQPRLFVLTPMTASMTPNGGVKKRGNRSVGVQPVIMPEYLDRPEIVSYAGPNELATNRDDRWAERLPANITRVLAENLSILLGSDHVHVLPSRRNDRYDLEVSVEFERFEQTVSGDSVLEAHWTVHDGASQKVIVRDRTRLTNRVPGSGYAPMVAAMNENLTVLSRDIATRIENLGKR